MKSCDSFNEEPLYRRVAKSGIWIVAARIAQQAFYLARTIVLARLLSPNDFGLFGIALLTLATLDTFSRPGFRQALIQKKENTAPYLDTAWTAGVLRGFIIAGVLFFIAPYAAVFFNVPGAEPLLKVTGLAIVFQSLTNIAVVCFEKELEFNKYFVYQVSGGIVDLIVAISAAIILRSAWALVLGRLAGDLMRCIISYSIDPYRPRIRFKLSQAKELFGFGRWILGSSVLIFLITHGDDIFVGKLLGATALGFYQMAYLISNLPATEITHVISQVTFPAYSKIQDDISRLRDAYLKVLQVTAFLSFTAAGLIFALMPDFTRIFLGEKWMSMVPAARVLVFAGLARSIMATAGPVIHAVGKPKIETKWQIIRFFALVVLIYPFTVKNGILGTAMAVLISAFVPAVGFSKKVIEITECKLKEFGKIMIVSCVNAAAIILIISLLKLGISDAGVLEFGLFVCVSGVMIVGLIYLFEKLFNYRLRLLVKELFSSLKGSIKP